MDDDPSLPSLRNVGHGTILDSENEIGSDLGSIMFNLCVNFLMYCVLIIVFYMLTRFYLNEDTEYHTSAWSASTESTPTEKLRGYSQDIREEDTDAAPLLDGVDGGASTAMANSDGIEMTSAGSPTSKNSNQLRDATKGKFINLNEWGEPDGTKQEVVQRAIWCAVGLHVSFGVLGLVQERMLTMDYAGEYFVWSYGLVFINRLGGLLLSAVLMRYVHDCWVPCPVWEYSFPSVANMLSSWCQYEALKYVTFPTQMLFKAFKIVPTMLMGYFMHDKHYEPYEYMVASTIGFGVYIFVNSSEKIDFSMNVLGDPDGVTGTWCGIVLLLLFLGFDSFTGQWQSRMFTRNKSMDSLQMMLIMNAFSSAFSFITIVHQGELDATINFMTNHPSFLWHSFVFVICSTVGQLFIYYTIQKFGAVVFSIIMASRILFSVVLSCIVYDHHVSDLGYLGILVVFGAIGYRIQRKSEGQPLIRWKDQPALMAEKTHVFKEWHEHLDI
jgi:adenosine 3'-phospho 5'-phosphosulfate transporter B2